MRGNKKLIALFFALTIGTASVAMAAPGGSIGQGNISVYKGGELTEKMSGKNPIEDGALLVCDGKCMIKSTGITLVGADQAKLAIQNETDTFNLILREGQVDFIITDKARKIAFHTPEGIYSVAETVFNADSTPVVRGSILVNSDGKSEISVYEGKMVLATAEGKQTVDANSKLVLAQLPEAGAAGHGAALGGAAAFGAAGVVDNMNKDDSSVPSPSI